MARINNLTNFLTDVSAAIKSKLGSDNPIAASQFDTKIMEIETAGTYQEKEISITQNGNYNLLPDTGYDAISKVSMSINVEDTPMPETSATINDVLYPETFIYGGNVTKGGIFPANIKPYTEYNTLTATNRYCDVSSDGKTFAYASGKTIYVYRIKNGVLSQILTQATSTSYNATSCRIANDVSSDGKLNIFIAGEGHDGDVKQVGCLRLNLDSDGYPYSKYWYGVSANMANGWEGNWSALYPHPTRPDIVIAVFPSRDSRGTYLKAMQVGTTSITNKSSIAVSLKYDGNWSGAYDYSLGQWATDNLFYIQDTNLTTNYKITYTFDSNGNLTGGSSTSMGTSPSGFKSYTQNYKLVNKTLYRIDGTELHTFDILGTYSHLFETNAGLIIASIIGSQYYIYLLDAEYNLQLLQGPYSTNVSNPFNPSGSGHTFDKIRFISNYAGSNGKILVVGNEFNVGSGYEIHGTKYFDTSEADGKAGDLLLGKTLFSGNKPVTGTMPNNGALNYNPNTSQQVIPAGYTSGGTISAVTSEIDINIIPENIKNGVEILGVEGTYEGAQGGDATSDANLQAKYLLTGYEAVADGQTIQGAMRNYGSATITPTSEDVEIPEGYYLSLSIPVINAANCEDYTECSNALLSI